MKPEHYKDNEFIHLIGKHIGEGRKVMDIKLSNALPKNEMYEIPFNRIDEMDLNSFGKSIPYSRTNVVNIERYMLWYWSPIIGADCILLYLHLWEYCRREDGIDICYPKTKELELKMKMSRPTLNKSINILEENNFLIKIRRINKLNKKETSPVYKLRDTVPFLSKEQYMSLPDELKEKHDDYMKKFAKNETIDEENATNDAKIHLVAGSNKFLSKKARDEIGSLIEFQNKANYLLENMTEEQALKLTAYDDLLDGLMTAKLSKPSVEIHYKDAMLYNDEANCRIYVILQNEDFKSFHIESGVNYATEALYRFILQRYGKDQLEYLLDYVTLEEFISTNLESL